MLASMRSTVVIDDQLFKLAKRRAADLQMTLSDVINQALRDSLSKAAVAAPPFEMVTFGHAEAPVHHEPADLTAALLADESAHLRR